MKALILDRYGSPDHLRVGEIEKPIPRSDQVLVRVHAASVNDWDWEIVKGGLNRVFGGLLRPKITLGCDMAGRVEAVGKDVRKFKPDDEVYGDLCADGFGAFAEYACVKEKALAHKSPRMTFAQAASIPQAGMLALQALLGIRPLSAGQTVLINGAGGGVGTFAIQVAKMHDVEVTGVDSAEKLDLLRSMGFDRVVDYRVEDFTDQGIQYDLIVDVKTNRPPRDYLRALRPGGIYATVGGSRLLGIVLLGPWMGRSARKTLRLVGLKPNRDLGRINELFEAGRFTPVIDGPFEFTTSDMRKAFRYFGAGEHKGKVVVAVAG
jgi:NADPH:quinone reductase-like Zn-dependent oxidoreductase